MRTNALNFVDQTIEVFCKQIQEEFSKGDKADKYIIIELTKTLTELVNARAYAESSRKTD